MMTVDDEEDDAASCPVPDLLVPGRDGWTWNQVADVRRSRNTVLTGALRELRVAADLMERGHQVFRNLAPGGIDLVAYIRGQLVRVEVTTASRRADGSIPPPNKPQRYEYDLLAAVLLDGTIAYFGIAP